MTTVQPRRKNSLVYLCIIVMTWSLRSYGAVPVVGDTALSRNRHVAFGVPTSLNSNAVVISRAQYVLGWDYERRNTAWAAWELSTKQIGDVGRTNVFRLDYDLQDYLIKIGKTGVKPDEYKGSCLDRGHQVPSSDRTALLADNQATFYMSNMVPQAAYLNRVMWASFEKFLRVLVQEQDKDVNIYSGTVYQDTGTIGVNDDIEVPTRNFKIAVIKPAGSNNADIAQMRLLVVDFPNLTSKKTNPVTDHEQACYDSQHTVKLAEENRAPYWRGNISNLSRIESASGLSFAFLRKIPLITRAELDEMIGEQLRKTTPFRGIIDMIEEEVLTSF